MLTASFAESMPKANAYTSMDLGLVPILIAGNAPLASARTLGASPRTPAAFRAGALELGEQIAGKAQ
jgi:hypothetical protein